MIYKHIDYIEDLRSQIYLHLRKESLNNNISFSLFDGIIRKLDKLLFKLQMIETNKQGINKQINKFIIDNNINFNT